MKTCKNKSNRDYQKYIEAQAKERAYDVRVYYFTEGEAFIAEDNTRKGCAADGQSPEEALCELYKEQKVWDKSREVTK